MASNLEDSRVLSLNSHDTALCIVPPTHLTQDINRLRALYDKAYEKWPPHVNMIYPFVAPESLPHAVELVRATLVDNSTEEFQVRLDTAGFFTHKRHTTVYTTDSGNGCQELQKMRRHIIFALGQSDLNHQPHLTIGQSDADNNSVRDYLVSKVDLLPPVEWQVSELVVLIRDQSQVFGSTVGRMRVWGTIKLSEGFPLTLSDIAPATDDAHTDNQAVQPGTTYEFHPMNSNQAKQQWKNVDPSIVSEAAKHTPASISVSSYNVLIDTVYPPPTERYPIILENLLGNSSAADILVLQEVSDDFLSFLLKDEHIRSRYPFTSHGSPEQPEIGPLPSLRNIVVLSRWRFQWQWLPSEKRHKGSVVLQLQDIGTFHGDEFLPLIVTGVHLTCGLTDGSIAAKYSQVRTIIRHLKTHYRDNNWIIAGDFNITTSSYTVDAALKRNSITAQGASILSSLEVLFTDSGLVDCYFANRITGSSTASEFSTYKQEFGTLYDGEEGATFDPVENTLAADISGRSFHSRPQRYDRIFVKGDGFKVTSFNLFGLPDPNTEGRLGSDHWGIRAKLDLGATSDTENPAKDDLGITVEKAPRSLGTGTQLKAILDDHEMFPSEDEVFHRQQMFELIKRAVHQKEVNTAVETRLNIAFVVVPVGSYKLGVWDSSSDVDCLVIGTISPTTFFALMIQKLRRQEWQQIRVLRKVKAVSGTMLELEAGGVRFDLQYCAATNVTESWPQALELPSTDYIFDLPMQSLLKLNSIRDLDYLQRTIPDMTAFRLAYRFIKTWAKNRGIYSSKLGFLGGIHITLLLGRVCKLSFREAGAVSASDIICTFFKHYANFDWKNDMIYDPTYYKGKMKYHRSSREPMVILSIHPPKVNVARAATAPSVKTLEQEFKRADQLLSGQTVSWVDIAGTGSRKTGAADFLKAYSNYVQVDVQFWGGAATKGRMLIGWLEFRCVSLLVDINRKFPDIHARVWPARFTKMEEENTESRREYQGCFLIGLAKNEKSNTTGPMTDSDRRSAHISLVTLLNNFGEQIRSDENYFDTSFSWVDVSLLKQSELEGLRLDDMTWADGATTQDDDFDSDDDFGQDLSNSPETDDIDDGQRNLPLRNARPAPSTQVTGGPKLRPADEILSRLRWDTSFDSADYVVGYVDRFIGEKEVPIDRWKSEQTDDEFIPMHRVLYFKRRSDGERVWDREKRIDLIFNSGASKNGG
ncbi:DUF455 domain protein [Talaromyces proteolyticus]|uniref:polynucleotide adenylyltransferase n=1 Tax=Talaromyces proteolyticus TaxID=1131652 RepID=A0AAD4PUA2_9EURO|nr:DUF455 domain protein [Talaromyces proteolyticus]KAH8689073.1 DUF455 domain protein [Talaromyces proteolyticus]